MKALRLRTISAVISLGIFTGCANIVPPTGGKKDTTPPKLVEMSPEDSLLNTRVTRIEMEFDEFITINEPGKEIQVSPVLPVPVFTQVNGKKLTVKIPDSLLKENTTYRVSFGNSIKDLNEGNAFPNFNYIFSTGTYFDSLAMYGIVYDAQSGTHASGITLLLYDAAEPDSAVVKQKPLYVTNTLDKGRFLFRGLPGAAFRIYALKDDNGNLVYDGEEEKIGFIDSVIIPVDSVKPEQPIVLRVFKEIVPPDSLEENDSLGGRKKPGFNKRRLDKADDKDLRYSVAVDTSDIEKRTHDVNKPIRITFSNPVDTYNTDRVSVTFDSTGTEVEVQYSLKRDTTEEVLLLNTDWKENTVYTIRLLKDFVQDTSGLQAMPSKYIFRTKGEEDYGVIVIHLPTRYYGEKYLLRLGTEKDSIYQQPVKDTSVTIRRLNPDKYNIRIIVDENRNGIWDTGELFAKKQPELVIPYTDVIELKAGWENVIDFKTPLTEDLEPKPKPGKRDTPPKRGDKPAEK